MEKVLDEQSFYTVSDLCKLIPIGRNGVYKLVGMEDFPKIVLGKRIIIPRVQFWTFIDENLGNKFVH